MKNTATDKAIALRKQRNAAIKATKNPSAKFESCANADEKRRRCRDFMRALRKSKPRAARATSAKTSRGSSAAKGNFSHVWSSSRNHSARSPRARQPRLPAGSGKAHHCSAAEPCSAAKPASRHVPANCCGKMKIYMHLLRRWQGPGDSSLFSAQET